MITHDVVSTLSFLSWLIIFLISNNINFLEVWTTHMQFSLIKWFMSRFIDDLRSLSCLAVVQYDISTVRDKNLGNLSISSNNYI